MALEHHHTVDRPQNGTLGCRQLFGVYLPIINFKL